MRFEDFVELNMASLARLAGALTGDSSAADDILAEALFRVYRRWRRIGAMSNPEAYVRRVLVTTFLDEQRVKRRRRTYPTSEWDEMARPIPDRSGAVDDKLLVAELLEGLTRSQRAALTLKYLSDLDDQQIAEAMGCTTGTVRSHLAAGRKTLRLQYQNQEI